jgi:uncharacterized protein
VKGLGRNFPLTIAGLVLALGIPELGLPKLLFGEQARVGREVVWTGLALLVLLWVTRVERLPLASIGLVRPRWGTLWWGLAATFALLASAMLSFAVIAPLMGLQQNTKAMANMVQVPLLLMIITAIVAGISEEIVYRGYAIERLHFLTGRRWLAAALAGLAFWLTHSSWGGTQMIVVGFGTLIFVGLYLWKHDLMMLMLAHLLADLAGFALARGQLSAGP